MVLQTKENRLKLLKEMCNTENWQPCLSKIARKTGVPISTIYDTFKREKTRFELKVRLLSELEYLSRLTGNTEVQCVAENSHERYISYRCEV